MTKSGALKLSILFFITFILCLPDFIPDVLQIEFLCEPFDPCTHDNDAEICSPSCATQMMNGSNSHGRDEGWYLCQTKMDLQLLYNDTSQSGEHVMVTLAMMAGNHSERNISVFAFLNNTHLYTEAQNDQRLFYCSLPPDRSKCPHLNISLQENASASTTTSAKLFNSSLNITSVMPSVDELKCQPTSNSFLFCYKEHNVTAASATLPVTQTKRVWLALVLTVVVVTVITVGIGIVKSSQRYLRNSQIVSSARRRQLNTTERQSRQNRNLNVPEVSVAMCNTSDEDDVFTEIHSTENRNGENCLNVNYSMYKRSLSPIYEITETALDQEEINDDDDDEEDEQCTATVMKEELRNSHPHQHLTAQSYCDLSTYLHHRSNYSSSGHEEDLGL